MSIIPQTIIVEELCSVLRVSSHNLDYEATFLSLGGHSLSAVKLSSLCKKRGVRLLVDRIIRNTSLLQIIESGELLDPHPRHELVEIDGDDWLDQVEATGIDFRIDMRQPWDSFGSSDDSEDLSDQQELDALETPDSPLTEHSADEESVIIPASEMQLSLIHGSVKNPGTNIIRHFETYRPEHIPAVKAAWMKLFAQEPILRIRYSADLSPQQPSQFDWLETSTDDQILFDAWVNAPSVLTVVSSSWKTLTLTAPGLTGVPLKSVIIWSIHHALIDGFSAHLLLTKVRRAAAGKPTSPGPSSANLTRQLQKLRLRRKAEGDDFWARHSELQVRAATAMRLPVPALPEEGFGEHFIDFGISLDALGGIAQKCKVTPAAIFHVAWALVMAVFVDSDDINFGIVLSGRNLPLLGIDDAIGPFVNTLPLAISLSQDSTLRDLAVDVFQRMTDLAEYQWTTPENGFSRNFQSALAMQFDLYLADEDTPIHPIERPYSKQTSDIPLSLLIYPESICLQYSKSDFKLSDVERIGNLYRQAIKAFVRLDITVGIVQSSFMTPEVQQLVRGYGNCLSGLTSAFSITDDLVTLFERTAQMYPNDVAVERGDSQMTYAKLDEAASIVAEELSHHIGPGDVVCVDADRSLNWIVAIFGILKSGAVYCALDSGLTTHLRALNFQTSGAKVFLSPSIRGVDRRPSETQLSLAVDTILSKARQLEARQFARRTSPLPSSTAYICFTSGSTGTPKGVICSHEGLVAFQRDLEVRLFAHPGVKVAQIMSVAFDGSIHEIFSALCHGGTLVLPKGENIFEVLSHAHSAILTPSVAEVLDPDDFPSLQHVYLVGEPVKQAVSDRWAETKTLYNMYGPTEGTCGATIKKLLPNQPVTIGGPNPSTRLYILNSKGGLMPPGMIGEIYVAGVQVARGYLGMPDITAECFLRDSICLGTGEMMYKTGDSGFWDQNGEVVCLGRTDRQIKLRGFRLDLNDLEIRVSKGVPGLKSIAIARREDFLVAAIQPSTLDDETVASIIAKVLPVYALPKHLVFVDKFPMTRAGKLDYKEIVSDGFINISVDKSELRTPMEMKVASVWRKLLKLSEVTYIGPKSNFLQLGGNSMLQITLMARLSSTLKAKLPLKIIIESQSLGELSGKLEKLEGNKRPSLGRSQTLGPRKLSPIEEDWWSRYRLSHTTTTAFNVGFVATFPRYSIDRALMAEAWNTVLSRYSIFRGRYVPCGGSRGSKVERRYVEHAPRVQRVQNIDVWAEVNRPFDLTNDSAIRVALSEDTLAITLSHIVADLTTLNILLLEAKALYEGKTLEPVHYTYEESVVWEDEAPLCDLKFWTEYLDDYPGGQFEHNSYPERRSYRGTSKVYKFSDDLSSSMLAFSAKQDMSLQQLAIAAVALALRCQTDETDIVLGSPFINRSTEADMETVGLFLEPLPVRVRHISNGNAANSKPFLSDVRKSAESAVGHAVPWHKLLEHLDVAPEYPNHPLFEVMVTFHDSSNAVKLDIPGLTPCLAWSEGSKFSLMAEFTALESGKIILRMEYDSDQHNPDSIASIVATIAEAIFMLLSNLPYSSIKRTLREGARTHLLAVERLDVFGVPLNEI